VGWGGVGLGGVGWRGALPATACSAGPVPQRPPSASTWLASRSPSHDLPNPPPPPTPPQTCRWVAPDTFSAVGLQAAVTHQPQTREQRVEALQALLSCPV
jgi:hypothetical protein